MSESVTNHTGEIAPAGPSTAGMTTKVVKGSLWTLAGQIAPLAVSFVTTPFVIRLLGAQGYGVLVLVGLIPTYLAFADFGMSIASTKFAAEAHAEGDPAREARMVRTAALIALCSSLPLAVAIFALTDPITTFLNVPETLKASAGLALKYASMAFVLNLLSAIFNTPQLVRLRMDLNTLVNSVFRIIALAAAPLILYFGGGIHTVVLAQLVAALLTLVGHLYVSGKLLPQLFGTKLESGSVRSLIRYGRALAGAAIASILLVNLEKLVLTRTASIEALAHYAVAFTLAMTTTTLSSAMTQSLIPAFSQLLGPGKREQLNSLFTRSVRINIILMLPILTVLFVVARPFFAIWAGEEFGRESTYPFYILLIGLAFAINNYSPFSLLAATGRTDILAKVYWAELIPYTVLISVLTLKFGAIGAAAAWSCRVIGDTVLIFWFATRETQISFTGFRERRVEFAALLSILSVPVLIAAFFDPLSVWLFVLLPLGIGGYFFITWNRLLATEERIWLMNRFAAVFSR